MTTITLPPDLLAWAQAEVTAGRAESVEALVERRLREGQKWDEFIRSLKEAEAEADRDGWLDANGVFDELRARYADRP
jgi:hypothetical protein